MSAFRPRTWKVPKAQVISPDKTDKNSSVSYGGSHPGLITSESISSVGIVGPYPAAKAGKFEYEVCVGDVWVRRWASSVEIFNQSCTYLHSLQIVLGSDGQDLSIAKFARYCHPVKKDQDLIKWLRSLSRSVLEIQLSNWIGEWQEAVSGWAAPVDVCPFGMVAIAGQLASDAGVIRCAPYTTFFAVYDYLEVISNHRDIDRNTHFTSSM